MEATNRHVVRAVRELLAQDPNRTSTDALLKMFQRMKPNWPMAKKKRPWKSRYDDFENADDDFHIWTDTCKRLASQNPTAIACATYFVAESSSLFAMVDGTHYEWTFDTMLETLQKASYTAVKWFWEATARPLGPKDRNKPATCVITDFPFADSVPIFPSPMNNCSDYTYKSILRYTTVWNEYLETHFHKDVGYNVQALCKALFSNAELMESKTANHINLSPQLAALWAAGEFGLQPIVPYRIGYHDASFGQYKFGLPRNGVQPPNDTIKKHFIQLRFQWLPQGPHKPQELVSGGEDTMTRYTTTHYIPEDYFGDEEFEWLMQEQEEHLAEIHQHHIAYRRDGIPIESDQVITITADDPKDLPSMALLDLRWIYSQIAALAGFSNMTAEDWANDGEDGRYIPQKSGSASCEMEHDCSDGDDDADSLAVKRRLAKGKWVQGKEASDGDTQDEDEGTKKRKRED